MTNNYLFLYNIGSWNIIWFGGQGWWRIGWTLYTVIENEFIFIQSSHAQARPAHLTQPVNVSPRHFHSLTPVTTIYSSSSISAPQPQYAAAIPASSILHHRPSNVSPSPILATDWGASNVTATNPGEMPKLIHETSI